MNRARNRDSGFTLLEMLVAMVITTILLTVVYGSFYQGIRSWRMVSVHSDSEQQQYLLRRHLQQQLQNSLLIQESQTRNSPIAFEGNEDSIEFVAELSPLQGDAGLYRYRVTLKNEPAELDIQITPYGTDNPEQQQHLTLATSSPLQFEYSDSAGNDINWLERWPYKNRLPQLIRIFQPDTGQSDWLPLIIEPRRHRHAI
ncbi:prepilin-type N-terminal cleavage/methylation domain-containing protein [Amphritea atlantica]|uniref:Prepilin-type N-terminal cleavage/methylation domain-containing protein n=1 Tax=Amphritea atlantica TaxID=355243 RepID=A0A1H9GNI5_9GAMM|nr:prepilin-type N-terminal cleavage/methylation domain-containing protein [Amphritea atlantica]SEQ51610.1 prepilin-type N-terminal cleavage/methylation domain-containing protein [Amphritea atlantica]